MAAGYKARTTATQVAIREYDSINSTVLMRVANNSAIEVGTSITTDSAGNLWRKVAYAYQKHGYMMNDFIDITDTTSNKYYMIEAMGNFGNDILQQGHSDYYADDGEIHSIQRALNRIEEDYFSTIPNRPLMSVTVDGVFGSATKRAVENAQAFLGCDIDGMVGPHTKARLYFVAYNRGGWPLAENGD